MREIKFRGKTLGDELFFGDLIQSNGEPSIFDGTHRKYVKPESVAQLVGYDADGNEVYDDDVLVDEDGIEWVINEIPQIEMTIGGVPDYLYNPKHKFKLKK